MVPDAVQVIVESVGHAAEVVEVERHDGLGAVVSAAFAIAAAAVLAVAVVVVAADVDDALQSTLVYSCPLVSVVCFGDSPRRSPRLLLETGNSVGPVGCGDRRSHRRKHAQHGAQA